MLTQFDSSEHSHRRRNPLTDEWVLCSPHRTKRPWQGAVENLQASGRPQYDRKCYLCPGNLRANGEATPHYTSTFVFENDFPALLADDIQPSKVTLPSEPSTLFPLHVEIARGKCHVVCFHPRHDLTVAEMSDKQILNIVLAWQALYEQVAVENPWLKYTQIFENKGSIMGCSNPHPHGQVWSLSYIPSIPKRMLDNMKTYALSKKASSTQAALLNGRPCLLLDYVTQELTSVGEPESRVIEVGSFFVSLVPFWASWPYENVILPKLRHIPSLSHMTSEEKRELALMIGKIGRRMDNLFRCSFGYSMGIYQAPISRPALDWRDAASDDLAVYAQFHLGFYPPLLRSSSVRKFLVGFELFAETQRDITPEQAAAHLRRCSDIHYDNQTTSD